MNILVVQDTDWLVRGPHQQHHLMEMMAMMGHKIRVIDYEILWKTQGKREIRSKRQVFLDISRVYQGAGILIIRPSIIKISLLNYVSLAYSLRKEIKRQIIDFSPDVIVGLGILSSYVAVQAARGRKIPFVYYWIDVLHRLVPFILFQPLARILETYTLKHSHVILAINEKLRDCVTKMGASPERTFVLRAGIDVKQFSPGCNVDTIRKQYGIVENDIVLLFMGWLYNFSGLKEVIVKLAEVNDKRFKLLIVGEGDALEDLKQLKHKYRLQDRVILIGKRPYHEIPALVAASDICLLPAYPTEKIMQDIVPIKMYEYMVMAKPVISTRLPGIMKEFGEGNGVVYVDQPEKAVEKAVELVLAGNLRELGAKARSFVEKYSWDNITDEFEKILQKFVIAKGKEGDIARL